MKGYIGDDDLGIRIKGPWTTNFTPPTEIEMNLYELHEKMTGHLFPSYSNHDERFLALALAGEVGELCNMIKKRWRDGADLTEEIREEICDCRIYLELIAKCFDLEGEKLNAAVGHKLHKVAAKHAHRLNDVRQEPNSKG